MFICIQALKFKEVVPISFGNIPADEGRLTKNYLDNFQEFRNLMIRTDSVAIQFQILESEQRALGMQTEVCLQ